MRIVNVINWCNAKVFQKLGGEGWGLAEGKEGGGEWTLGLRFRCAIRVGEG